MSIAQAILKEFEEQAPITRKFLERLPEDQLACETLLKRRFRLNKVIAIFRDSRLFKIQDSEARLDECLPVI